jgi:predicted HAD superfamily Cof-like phosphohydrolase
MTRRSKLPLEDTALTQTFHPLTMWEQICIFHEKYGINTPLKPDFMPDDVAAFRVAFLEEELAEFKLAIAENDLAEQIDALVDLVVVAMGTAHILGFKWDSHWNEVYEANMRKVRAEGKDDERSKRKHFLDIVKPSGWEGPNHRKYIDE